MINTNIKKQYKRNNKINSKFKQNIQLLSIGVIVSEKFCFRKCVCLLFTSLSCLENSFLPNDKGNKVQHSQI